MEMFFKKFMKKKKIVFIMIGIIFCIGVLSVIYFFNKNNDNVIINDFVAENSVVDDNQNMDENTVVDNNQNNEAKEKNVQIQEHGKSEVNNTETINSGNKTTETKIYIHIVGEVQNEGVIELMEGARIIDAVEKAGGTTENADLSKINLVFILSDGQKVKIPSKNDKQELDTYVIDGSGNSYISGGNSEKNNYNKVNINTANQTELETLSGIGPSLAAKILEYRKEKGLFKNINELKNVSGIGESKFNNIKDNIVVK